MALTDTMHKHPVIFGNTRIPLFFKFTQNPNKFTFTMTKEYDTTRTIGGYVFEQWGKKPTILKGDVRIKKDSGLETFLGIQTQTTGFELQDPTYCPELITLQTLFNIDQRKFASKGLLTNTISTVSSAVSSGVAAVKSLISTGNVASVTYETPSQNSLSGYLNTITDTIIYYKGCIYSGFFTDMVIEEDASTPFFFTVNFTFVVTNTTFDWIDTLLVNTAAGRTILEIWGLTTSTITLASLLDEVISL
jgi:hypothetical protein